MSEAARAPRAALSLPLAQAAAVLGRRKTAVMLAFGFAAGLPNAMMIGSLNAWFGIAGVDLATIGVISWIGLAYAFKFLWSPAVNLPPPLGLARLGRRRGWIVLCQGVIGAACFVIAMLEPGTGLGTIALAAAVAAFASATQDMAIDAWRIEAADAAAPIDMLSAVYQFGYRTAALVGGAGALLVADAASWNVAFALSGLVMIAAMLAAFAAPEPPAPDMRAEEAAEHKVPPGLRAGAVAAVLVAWAWASFEIVSFMIVAVTTDPPPSARAFTQAYGAWIVAATVVLPCFLAALIANGRLDGLAQLARPAGRMQRPADRLYGAIVAPLVELMARLSWAALLVLVLILSYRITDSIWGPFAFPFYLNELKYTQTEVALASKTFGVIMTVAGVGLGALALVWLGRMPSLLIGAIVAAASNLLFADLARGAPWIDGFLVLFGLDHLFAMFGLDMRMTRLLVAITGENLSGGFAGAAFVAYLSALASRMHGAVQFAVFTSLTMLVGTLGRAALGEAIQTNGYAPVFEFAAALGLVAVAAVALEWLRTSRLNPGRPEPG